jgi:transaldolase/glucose-6-phosphate isomerase
VQAFGQSFWYDNIQRGLIQNGELRLLIDDYGVLGITSNPAIFEKAITSSNDYDYAMQELVNAGCYDTTAIYEKLAIADIQATADLLEPVYEQTQGVDGYVSLEVSPFLARDCEGTVKEARRLFSEVGRKNLMVKVPATPECIPAIQRLIADGININVTLIFSLEGYEQVARAFIAGIAERAKKGLALNVASVASFFVSRVDSLVDKLLEEKMPSASEKEKTRLVAVKHNAAIANAKLAYEIFERVFAEKEWLALIEKGARSQRVLWASTSTKTPSLPDTYYVDALIGPSTVNTLPPATLKAFYDHGTVDSTLKRDIKAAHMVMKELDALGISMPDVWQKLQNDGVNLFADAFKALLASVEGKKNAILAQARGSCLGDMEHYASEVVKLKAASRLWAKDATLWSTDVAQAEAIQQRLGWLTNLAWVKEQIEGIGKLRDDVIRDGYTDVVVLGMGGSSLASEMFRHIFTPSHLRLHILDTTDPNSVQNVTSALDDLCKTLFVVASKSGSTVEVLSFYAHFRSKMDACAGEEAGRHFVAITDEGTSLQRLAADESFRHIYINPSDVGGRYSAFSYFGLVPAILLGVDVGQLVDHAMAMTEWCKYDSILNPGLWLGAVIGGAALLGQDKLVFIVAPQIHKFGMWVEQLIAESTGKCERGIVPIVGDEVNQLKNISGYNGDRLFVHLHLAGDTTFEKTIAVIEQSALPLIEIHLNSVGDIGAEIFRWEFAVAIAGMVLGVNPFDEPNVSESKHNTKRLLSEYENTGQFMIEASSRSPNGQMNKFLRTAKKGDYICIQAYLPNDKEIDELLVRLRVNIGTRYNLPVTVGYGPRYLHSTGQLHKGGANNIVALQLTYDPEDDLGVPGEPYTFGTLMRAQALGDYEAQKSHLRRVMRLHLGKDPIAGLKRLAKSAKGPARRRSGKAPIQ